MGLQAHAAHLLRRRRLPIPGASLHCVKIVNALLQSQTSNPFSLDGKLFPGNSVKYILPPIFPLAMRVAKLKCPIGPVSPAPTFVKPRHDICHARAMAHPRAGSALGSAQRTRARQCGNRHAVPARREVVLPVSYHTERKPFSEVGYALGGELGSEGGFRVELAEPGRVEFWDEGEAGESDYGGVEVSNAEPVVESTVI